MRFAEPLPTKFKRGDKVKLNRRAFDRADLVMKYVIESRRVKRAHMDGTTFTVRETRLYHMSDEDQKVRYVLWDEDGNSAFHTAIPESFLSPLKTNVVVLEVERDQNPVPRSPKSVAAKKQNRRRRKRQIRLMRKQCY